MSESKRFDHHILRQHVEGIVKLYKEARLYYAYDLTNNCMVASGTQRDSVLLNASERASILILDSSFNERGGGDVK